MTKSWAACCLLLAALAQDARIEAVTGDTRLVQAVQSRNVTVTRSLLRQGVRVDTRQPDGATALHWAAHWDDLETAALLTRAGADPNAATDHGIVPLYLACVNGSARMVQTLLAAGAKVGSARPTGETPLMTCSRTGVVGAVQALLDAGADVHAKEPAQGQTALMWAAAQNHPDVVRLLIERKADVNAMTALTPKTDQEPQAEAAGGALRAGAQAITGFTPLLFATKHGAERAVRVLLDHGADIDHAASDGSTPLLAAVYLGHWELAKVLLARGADPNIESAGFTPLHWAAGSWETDISGKGGPEKYKWIGGLGPGKLDLVRALLTHGANPNARLKKAPPRYGYAGLSYSFNLRGATPFFLAAMGGHLEIARALLAAGADPLAMTEDRTTVLMAAAGLANLEGQSVITQDESLKAVMFALELGHNVHAANNIGQTALHGAADAGRDEIVRVLVEKGADVNAKNGAGSRPLTLAAASVAASRGPRDSTAALLQTLGAIADAEVEGVIVSIDGTCPNIRIVLGRSDGQARMGRGGPAVVASPATAYASGACADLTAGITMSARGRREYVSNPIDATQIVLDRK